MNGSLMKKKTSSKKASIASAVLGAVSGALAYLGLVSQKKAELGDASRAENAHLIDEATQQGANGIAEATQQGAEIVANAGPNYVYNDLGLNTKYSVDSYVQGWQEVFNDPYMAEDMRNHAQKRLDGYNEAIANAQAQSDSLISEATNHAEDLVSAAKDVVDATAMSAQDAAYSDPIACAAFGVLVVSGCVGAYVLARKAKKNAEKQNCSENDKNN